MVRRVAVLYGLCGGHCGHSQLVLVLDVLCGGKEGEVWFPLGL